MNEFDITIDSRPDGEVVITARSWLHLGAIHLRETGMVFHGDFLAPVPVIAIDLLTAAMEQAKQLTPRPMLTPEDTFCARIVTDDSVEPDDDEDGPRQRDDIVITADSHPGVPVAAYSLHYRILLDPHGEDPDVVLEQSGWRRVGEGHLDRWNYLVTAVERIR